MSFNSINQKEITTWLTKKGNILIIIKPAFKDVSSSSHQYCYLTIKLRTRREYQKKLKCHFPTFQLMIYNYHDQLVSYYSEIPREKDRDEQCKRDPGATTEVNDKKRNYLAFYS